MKIPSRKIVLAPVLLLLALVVFFTQNSLDQKRSVSFTDNNPVFLPNGKLLRWLSMGYPALVGDWLWMRSVLYYGRRTVDEENQYYVHSVESGRIKQEMERVKREPVHIPMNDALQKQAAQILYQFDSRGLLDYIYPLLDRSTAVDPRFIFPYIFGGVYVLMSTGELDAAEALLQKGYRENPDNWQLPFYLGWFYWMYRGDTSKSVRYMLQAVGKTGCPGYVYNLLQGLARKDIMSMDITVSYLQGIYKSTDNSEIRSKIEELLKKLERERKR